MDDNSRRSMADGTGILDGKKDKTFGTSEEGTGRPDSLAYTGALGVTGANVPTGNGATNVAAAAAMASGLAGDGDDRARRLGGSVADESEADERTSVDRIASERLAGMRTGSGELASRRTVDAHAGAVTVSSERDWLHETGLHGDEMAAELGTVSVGAPGPARAAQAIPARPDAPRGNDRGGNRRAAAAETAGAGRALGWAALLFAVVSLFIWPLLMGATAAVLGYIAYRQGARSLGVWAMTLGIIAAAAYFILSPLYAALT